MTNLKQNANFVNKLDGGDVLSGSAQSPAQSARPANHNLTQTARDSNVVLFGGHLGSVDFRPDRGARISLAA